MRHVVVVEDDAVNALLLRTVLQRRGGFKVTLTEDPAEVLGLARAGGVDLILLDVSLGQSYWEGRAVSGVDICRLLKGDDATAAIPVILATAHAMRGDSGRFLADSGANDYVAKPIVDLEAFIAQVRSWMPAEAA